MSNAGLSDDVEGPVLQAPLSAHAPVRPGDVAGAQPEGSGEPTTSTPQEAELATPPAIPGLDETTWTQLAPEDRQRLMPVLRGVEQGVTEKMEEAAKLREKAELWDSFRVVPEVSTWLNALARGENAQFTQPGQQAQPAGRPSEASDALDLSEMMEHPDRLQSFIDERIQAAVDAGVKPLRDQVLQSTQVLSQLVLENQKAQLSGEDAKYWEQALDLVRRTQGQISVREAVEMIRGREALKNPPAATPPPAENNQADLERQAAATIVRPTAGTAVDRMNPTRRGGKITADLIKESLREHGFTL